MTERTDEGGAAIWLGASAMLFASLLFAYTFVRSRADVVVQGDYVLMWGTRVLVVVSAALRWFDFRILAAIAGAGFVTVLGLRGWALWDAGFRPNTSAPAAVLTIVFALYAAHAVVATAGLLGRRPGWRLLWVFLAVVWLAIDGLAAVW
jgi:hypothetical protein